MTVHNKNNLADSSCASLLFCLLNNFPNKIEVDYFNLCKVDPLCVSLPASAYDIFNTLTAFIEAMINENIVKGDFFADGKAKFFWNVVFTAKGYQNANKLLNNGSLNNNSDNRRLLIDLCLQDLSNPNTINKNTGEQMLMT